jgi:hypothetical protein
VRFSCRFNAITKLNQPNNSTKPFLKLTIALCGGLLKANLIWLIDEITLESEEFHKRNLMADFFEETYFDPNHFINAK